MVSPLKRREQVVNVNEFVLESWEELKEELRMIKKEREELARQPESTHVSELLYRGQSDATWPLSTTLERESGEETELLDYHGIISRIKPRIESATGKEWAIPSRSEFSSWIKEMSRTGFLLKDNLPAYEYMAYLRHNGFPSPLLDWTESYLIASFFAFRRAKQNENKVAIFAYGEYGARGKMHSGNSALISTLHPYIRTHNRHYLQQSRYTICTRENDDGQYFFTKHEEGISAGNSYGQNQDVIWKFVIPSNEWKKVNDDLKSSNINPYSLFASEESLMETLAIQEFSRCM